MYTLLLQAGRGVTSVILMAALCLAWSGAATGQASLELLSVLRHDAVTGAHDIEVRGDFAYVAGKANRHQPGKAGRFAVVDVSNPQSPLVRAALSEEDSPALHNAQTVLLMDDLCLLGTDDLLAIDIADPDSPRIVATVRHDAVERINGMIAWGDTAIAANKTGQLNVFDISDPRRPDGAGSLDTRAHGNVVSPHDIARLGARHVVVPGAGREAPVHFAVYAVSRDGDTVLPVDEWRCTGTIADQRLAGANRVVVDEQYAYVACHYSNRIGVIDLADPGAPALAATIPTRGAEPDGLALQDGVLFVGAGKTVEAIDVSSPEAPRSLAVFRGGPLFTKPEEGRAGNAHDLVVRDDLVYVTAQRDGAIGILRFTRE